MGEIYTDLHLGPLYQRPRFGRAFYSSPKAERHRFHDLPAGGLVQRDTFVAEAETLCDNGPLVLRQHAYGITPRCVQSRQRIATVDDATGTPLLR
jgi:hypothetical protein